MCNCRGCAPACDPGTFQNLIVVYFVFIWVLPKSYLSDLQHLDHMQPWVANNAAPEDCKCLKLLRDFSKVKYPTSFMPLLLSFLF